MSFDELSGRELDAAVAAHVFGYQVEERASARTRQRDFVYALQPDSSNRECVRVPFYTASMGASLNIELALRDRGWK